MSSDTVLTPKAVLLDGDAFNNVRGLLQAIADAGNGEGKAPDPVDLAVDASAALRFLARFDPDPTPLLERQLRNARKAMKAALAWCEQDRDNEDGHPTQGMLEARCEALKVALRILNFKGGA